MKAFPTAIILIFTATFLNTACKKEKINYKLQGQVVNGTAHAAIPGVKIHVIFEPHSGFPFSSNAEYRDLGWVTTDSNGHFLFNYEEIKGSGYMSIKGDVEKDISDKINRNADFTIYQSDSGIRRMLLNTVNPLGATDTLFVAFEEILNNKIIFNVDTFLNLPINFQKNIRLSTNSRSGIYWGRGANNLVIFQDQNGNFGIKKRQGFGSFTVRGDPFIDEVLINY